MGEGQRPAQVPGIVVAKRLVPVRVRATVLVRLHVAPLVAMTFVPAMFVVRRRRRRPQEGQGERHGRGDPELQPHAPFLRIRGYEQFDGPQPGLFDVQQGASQVAAVVHGVA